MLVQTSGITTKFLVKGETDLAAEVVLVKRPDKNIICFSTQYGCLMGYTFCVSGLERDAIRSLSYFEMMRLIDTTLKHIDNGNPIVLSAMGEGEPCLNMHDVVTVLANASMHGFHYDVEVKTALSTVAPSIRLFKELLDYCLFTGIKPKIQYSLHAADDNLRRSMIRTRSATTTAALKTMSEYPEFVYDLNVVLIEGLNDTEEAKQALSKLLLSSYVSPSTTIKFNRFNTIKGSAHKPSDKARYWAYELNALGFKTELYGTDGAEIDAACGQLRKTALDS